MCLGLVPSALKKQLEAVPEPKSCVCPLINICILEYDDNVLLIVSPVGCISPSVANEYCF
jgi:hypothetical protein